MGAFDAVMEIDLIQVRRATVTGKDALGRPLKSLALSEPVNGLLTAMTTASGEHDNAYVVDQFSATLPLGTDLRANDEIVARGRVYTVEGTPWESVVPRTRIGVLNAVVKYVGPVGT